MERENNIQINEGSKTHTYEEFTQRPFYIDINRQTVRLAPRSREVLDIATGVGGIIDLLIEEDKMHLPPRIVGIDIDTEAITRVKEKFSSINHVANFKVGRSEEITEGDNSFDLVTFCNAIHLTDVRQSLKEVYRVLKPDGAFIANSAFVAGVGYPTPEAQQLWKSLGAGAMRKAMRAGHRPERNQDFVNYSVDDYKQFAKEAGFDEINTEIINANMDKGDVLAICHYDEFAKGVLQGVPLEIAHESLSKTAEEMFALLEKDNKPPIFPRSWVVFSATK